MVFVNVCMKTYFPSYIMMAKTFYSTFLKEYGWGMGKKLCVQKTHEKLASTLDPRLYSVYVGTDYK